MARLSEAGSVWRDAPRATVADQIRALNAKGHSRAEIARMLGKRYQHIRNVLEADKVGRGQAAPAQPADPDLVFKGPFRLVVERDGSVVLPPPVLTALGVGPGGVLVGRLRDGDFVVTEIMVSARRAQAMVRAMIPGDASLADELIADRRREAAKEADD